MPKAGEDVSKDAVTLLLKEQASLREVLAEVVAEERRLFDAHAFRQERLLDQVLKAHWETVTAVRRLTSEGQQTSGQENPEELLHGDTSATLAGADAGPHLEEEEEAQKDAAVEAKAQEKVALDTANAELDRYAKAQTLLESWRTSHGMHTVEGWMQNYKMHPGGWGALLMIHGVPEITSRLRSKVDNFAIYSALLLAVSIPLMYGAPDGILANTHGAEGPVFGKPWEYWAVEARKRVYFYSLMASCALHFLSILLGMTFNNVLNQAARDSDVFRMFSKGRGFVATVKCEKAFSYGSAALCIGVGAALTTWLHVVEVLLVGLVLIGCCGRVLKQVADLLYSSGCILGYWRWGGKPQAKAEELKDDPYNLEVPLLAFKSRMSANQQLFMEDSELRSALPDLCKRKSPEQAEGGDGPGVIVKRGSGRVSGMGGSKAGVCAKSVAIAGVF